MKPTIFFDGGCPLCRREIGHYRRLDAADRCRWVDISLEPGVLASYGIDYGAAMARLHAVDAQGAVVSGVAAFVVTWRELPGYRHLAHLLERFALVPFLDRIYARFAAWRLRRRCREGTCLPRG
jgi:predicted DCC family thiol-disulfide oxidoreductase YuxK